MAGTVAPQSELILSLLVGIAVVLASVYLFHRIRRRRGEAQLREDGGLSDEDRAFNMIRLARAGCDRLAAEGFDVRAVAALVAEAESAERRGSPTVALRSAARARELLLALRTGGSAPPSPLAGPERGGYPPSRLASGPGAPFDPGPSSSSAAEEEVPRRKLPPFQVESRFAITSLERELAAPIPAGAEGAHGEAAEYLRQAEESYRSEGYAEAWRLALRGRRRLGGTLETVAAPPSRERPASAALPSKVGAPEAEPAGRGPASCPTCGRPNAPSDRFCRGCGALLGAATCARCGTPNAPDDRFCGACGTPSDGA
jgi:Double zinc ribbon